jgi:hypothetical protein
MTIEEVDGNRESKMPEVINNLLSGKEPRGIALLTVLLMIMVITVVAVGFLARADVELACGQNMLLRLQMDQLAGSALEHTRGLFLHPQDVEFEYWPGATGQQLIEDGLDYYDVAVTRDAAHATDYCTYDITCEAYRRRGVERTAQSRLLAQLRLDPCLALWTGTDLVHRAGWSCYGDLYCTGAVDNAGRIDGDVFAALLSGTAKGQRYPPNQALVVWPHVMATDFTSRYPSVPIAPGTWTNTAWDNPSWIFCCNGDLVLAGNVTVEGMLLVTGNLTVRGNRNIIRARKDPSAGFVPPALYVTGDLILHQCDGLAINGLAVVDGSVLVGADTANVSVTGALFAAQQVAETAIDSSGGGNDAILHSKPGWSPSAGANGAGALQFDGADDYLQTRNSATQLQITDDYTISVWLKPAATQNAWAGVVTRCSADGLTNHWTLQFGLGGNILRVFHTNSAEWDTEIDLSELGGGVWHHVAMVRQGAGMTAYLDGEVHKSELPALNTVGNPLAAPGAGDGHLIIGAERDPASHPGYCGLLDDIRIYNCALVLADIQQLYAMKNIASVPIGHWRLDEGGSAITVTAQPTTAAIVLPVNNPLNPAVMGAHWSPAGGAFFKSVRRP